MCCYSSDHERQSILFFYGYMVMLPGGLVKKKIRRIHLESIHLPAEGSIEKKS